MFISLKGDAIERARIAPLHSRDDVRAVPVQSAVENNADFALLYTRQLGKTVSGFFIYSHDPAVTATHSRSSSTSHRVRRCRPSPTSRTVDGHALPGFNTPPESIKGEHNQQMHVEGLLLQTLHAPGEITWKLDGSEEEFVFDFGFLPEAVVRGDSDGANFIVSCSRNRSATRTLPPLVDPAHQHADPRQPARTPAAPGGARR